MDVKPTAELMRMTMLKKMMSDSSMDTLTGSSKNSEMFKMLLQAMVMNDTTGNQATGANSQADQNALLQLMMTTLQGGTGTSGSGIDLSAFGLSGEANTGSSSESDGADLFGLGLMNSLGQSTSTAPEQNVGNSISAAAGQSAEVQAGATASKEEIQAAISAAANKYGVDEDFIKAIVKQESGFRSDAVSKAGAMGLMQLMPKTAESLGVENPFNVLENIDGGTRYIKKLINSFDGSKELALSAYNGGIGRMNKRGVDTVDEIGNMPKETQNYVAKVMSSYSSYKK